MDYIFKKDKWVRNVKLFIIVKGEYCVLREKLNIVWEIKENSLSFKFFGVLLV